MTKIAMERSTFFILIGKPSFSMGHLYHGYVSQNQKVNPKVRWSKDGVLLGAGNDQAMFIGK